MLKKKENINVENSFIKACKKNNIKLTPKDTNRNPVSYIDISGNIKKINEETNINTNFSIGDIVRVHHKTMHGKYTRPRIFEGIVSNKQKTGAQETFTVRKALIGIHPQKTWSLYSPNIEKIEVVRSGSLKKSKPKYSKNFLGKKRTAANKETMKFSVKTKEQM